MIKLKEAVIVEGKYDKIKLKGIIDAPIIETNGFRIFKDKEKQALIRRLAYNGGIIIITDSDSAGFVIRNFLKGIVDNSLIKNCYIPEILGKEKRKDKASKEGLLGVEGVEEKVIIEALKKCGITESENTPKGNMTKQDFFEMGLSGKANSAELRQKLLKKLNMPSYLTTNSIISMLNKLYSKQEILDILKNL